MNNNFFAYLHQLELLAFFSAYPLLHAVVFFIAGNVRQKNNPVARVAKLLPFSYAFTGLLYAGLQLKNLYASNLQGNFNLVLQQPYLTLWGICAILFFIPTLPKHAVWCLLHSMFFFLIIIKDVVSQLFNTSAGNEVVKNEMTMFSDSLLLQSGSICLVILVVYAYGFYKRKLLK